MIETNIQQIFDTIIDVCPANWEQIALHCSRSEDEAGKHGGVFFYVKADGVYYDSGILAQKCKISITDMLRCYKKLDMLTGKQDGEKWCGFSLIITNGGDFKLEYEYTPCGREEFKSKYIH